MEDEEARLKKERAKGRLLRASPWWQRKKQPGICHYCGGTYSPAALTMDHIVPLVRGGRSTRGNIVPCCKECNNRKQSQLVMEWEGTWKA